MDWTRPPLSGAPGNLGPALEKARLAGVENDRPRRRVVLRFELPPEAGPSAAAFAVEEATHLLAFAYLPPAAPLAEGLPPEEVVAQAVAWAHQGLVTTLNPDSEGLIVTHAELHAAEGGVTLALEGYGEDPDAVVWWRLEAGGKSLLAEP